MRRLAFCLIALFAFTACKKSVEGESKRWDSGIRTVDELGVLYPSFKAALEVQRQKAIVAMDAAKSVADEKERISKMASANNLLMGGFAGQLRDVDATIKQIRQKLVEVTGKSTDESDRLSAKQAADGAERVLADVAATLRRGAQDPASADVLLKKVTADLRAAQDNIDKVARATTDKQTAKQPQTGAQAGSGQPGTATEPAAAASWTCEYCSTANSGDATVCSNCGAAHPTGN